MCTVASLECFFLEKYFNLKPKNIGIKNIFSVGNKPTFDVYAILLITFLTREEVTFAIAEYFGLCFLTNSGLDQLWTLRNATIDYVKFQLDH